MTKKKQKQTIFTLVNFPVQLSLASLFAFLPINGRLFFCTWSCIRKGRGVNINTSIQKKTESSIFYIPALNKD